MTGNLSLKETLLVFGLPLCILVSLALFASSDIALSNSLISKSITLDLIITIPFIHWVLIRKKDISKFSVLSFFVIGILIASFVIPEENQSYISFIKNWILPFIELGIVTAILLKIRKTIQVYRLTKNSSPDFFTILKKTCSDVFPKKISEVLAMEIAVFYYGFISWKKKTPRENEYTYHKDGNSISIFIGILMIVIIETFVLHKMILKSNPSIAWIVGIMSVYSFVQIFGFVKSITKRPITIDGEILHIRYGIMSEVIIPISDIDTIEFSSSSTVFDKETRRLSPLGELDPHNMLIRLKKQSTGTKIGLYGIKRNFKAIAFHVDQKNQFKDDLEQLMLSK
ncbi:hypothetical protein [uncultured Aquimarina sp.]|uniref:hypothetical protein n=1 Tax=uncultured Aquimarina sp. TaxID=575652 RepID=UPI002623BD5D|nr:hypothetical protein [uncultured Aquimarina sp.]